MQSSAIDPLEAAKHVAQFLRSKFGATRIFLFGSLASGDYRPGHSDIDIYFEGVPHSREGAAGGLTMIAFPDLPLDLRPAGYCESGFRQRVMKFGIAL